MILINTAESKVSEFSQSEIDFYRTALRRSQLRKKKNNFIFDFSRQTKFDILKARLERHIKE
jgi:hypothetical protein